MSPPYIPTATLKSCCERGHRGTLEQLARTVVLPTNSEKHIQEGLNVVAVRRLVAG